MLRNGPGRAVLGTPAPSKWDDAHKWLAGLSRKGVEGRRHLPVSKPRNSNADDTRLIAPAETKNVDFEESLWRIRRPAAPSAATQSICVRDMGTEMTPNASQEPSRTATPVRAGTPVARSPISSGSATPRAEGYHCITVLTPAAGRCRGAEEEPAAETERSGPLESRARAWDEAERAKSMARFKREEVKIQAWENNERRKAEMEMKRVEATAERLKSRAEERRENKLAATRRMAEERRARAEAKLNKMAAKTAERADCIRRTGLLPSSFPFKLPSLCG